MYIEDRVYFRWELTIGIGDGKGNRGDTLLQPERSILACLAFWTF
jgi:hypothetical protein